ncbi:ribosome small subunit-dependent GTPase A [Halothermothrix orenii]|uniref:Small ribosomal subunit biogenesis GTPase RsgA n=1 Tax=Halothermothrix orenii (strain H 168 / OCM 544 / DSM 9562) TaxID=373903 RepID=B8CWT4_HALOH|nr:ribosome small subunit-dependent GTPase A [Halothermothrix orenii]ACL69753.1 ribosome small subunit-dependent GTPase A [Halothermothrix orenii H 168]
MKGLVTKAVGGFFFVADEQQNIIRTRIRGKVKRKVYPGDFVKVNDAMIEKLYPRTNLLFRPAVANVDQVLVIHSIQNPPFARKMLDKFLIMVEAIGVKPVIIINKIDLKVPDIELEKEMKDYKEEGYQVYLISVKEKMGLNELYLTLEEKLSVLAGPSGVGKSSLIKALVPEARVKIGEVSQKLKRGVHTTRHVELLPINKGGWIADTPGFSALDLRGILSENLRFYFPGLARYEGQCKFRGCTHTHEPGCQVKKAVKEGMISEKRYNSYLNIYRDLEEREC